MADKANSNLLRLALQVQQTATQIVEGLSSNGLPEPTFEPSSESIPETTQFASLRTALNDAAHDLLRLVNGPKTEVRNLICTLYDLAAWQVACEFRFFDAIPESGCAELKEISKAVGLDEERVGRFLRILATDRVFEEVKPDVFKHTSRSVLYVRDQHMRDAVHYQLDEFFMAVPETSASLRASPLAFSRSTNPFVTRHGSEMFQFYRQDPKRASRFASAMAGIGKMERQFEDLRDSYPWNEVTAGKVVDVGGGNGHMSIALARSFPNLQMVVQDSLSMLAQASSNDISDLNGRVAFMQHSFFEPEPIAGAAAYLLRYVTHNWDDQDCIRIFKALVPALEQSAPQTPLLINDIVLPTAGETTLYQERRLRQVDIMMMVVLGAKQRTEADFRGLLKSADSRYRVKDIHGTGDMKLLEVVLDI
ncbi:sterigmatocystin 8-O-methyltransferase precursor [Trematosphaeria pertusa]|uniref:Sterigmatocystin 8-O-methyltransferase n=1 Tax=Trematosphaeria pertusa TaxID=390896 RepID=A0A6A6HSW2_9PLEO|nr:sterigmatocystin 8-O-methyltransferase precursor [Trematosphaeria pertusa]KAF2241265.1 sterigmatocystin 8-O-methyltransferase precursor [Trematosphaeria pertusa]